MGKIVKRYLIEGYQVDIAQIFLVVFFVLFILLMISVFIQPKKFYDENSRLPLDTNDELKD